MHRVGGWTYIDKSMVEESRLVGMRDALTIPNHDWQQAKDLGNSTKGIPEEEFLFEEDDREIRLPRQYGLEALNTWGWSGKGDGRVEYFMPEHSKLFRPRFGEQDTAVQRAIRLLRSGSHGAILVAPCGQGKTVMGVEVIRQMRQRTVILVHKEFLRDQWQEELAKFLPEVSVGLVQEDSSDWDKDVVIVMIQTILCDRKYPKKFFQGVGLVVSDEAHRLGAKKWRYAITQFPAKYRLLLTATPERRDGRHVVFERHVGARYHEMVRVGLRPRIEVMNLKTYMPPEQYTRPSDGQIILSRVVNMLSKNEVRNRKLGRVMFKALRARRQVLVLSDRLEQLDVFHSLLRPALPSDVVISKFVGGSTKKVKKERARAPDSDLILGTFAMAQEGLNIPTMSVLMMTTPKADVQQAVGRILRPLEGKGEPVLVDPVDRTVPICIGLAAARWKQYRKLGYA